MKERSKMSAIEICEIRINQSIDLSINQQISKQINKSINRSIRQGPWCNWAL